MNLSPFVISQIRTLVPIAVGALLTWLATTLHVVIDPSSQAGLVVLATGVLSSVYYALVHLLEQKVPKAGLLLGVAKVPTYTASVVKDMPVPVAEAVLAPDPATAPVSAVPVTPPATV